MVTNSLTINKIIDIFQEWSIAKSPFINDFGFGPIWDFGTSRQMDYPCMWVDLETSSSINITNRSMVPEFNLIVMFLDKENIQTNVDNINGMRSNNVGHIMSDQFQIGQDFINDLILSYSTSGFNLINSVIANKVYDETTDKVYGWAFSFTMRTSVINCKDLSIIPPSTCLPSKFQNSNGTYSQIINSGNTFTSQDITITLANGIQMFPSNIDIDLSDYAPSDPIIIHNSDNSFTTTATGGDDVELQDIEITLGDGILTYPSVKNINLSQYYPIINPEPGIYIPGDTIPWNEVNPNVIVNSGSILKTLNDNDWNAGADFIIEKNGDFILNFNLIDTLSDLSVNVMTGVDYFKANNTFNYVGIDMAFYRVAQNAYIFENSINVYQYPLIINDNTLYTIERIGNIINYKIDGNIVRTKNIINISKMYFTSSIFKSGSEIRNINIEY